MGPETQTESPVHGEVAGRTPRIRLHALVLCAALAAAVLAAYANHFQNDFQFDDSHTIVNNFYITKLSYIPKFFTDANTFSSQPTGRTWRPLVSTSLAIDYWLGRGRKPFFFHLSTFLWYIVQLILMFYLFRRIMDAADPHPTNIWTALAATACYGLHPAMAETVNYIIQRADLYVTLGVVASLLLFIAYPAKRKYCLYMLPAIAAYMSKASALVFPFILLAYVFLFEREPSGPGSPAPSPQILAPTWPAFAITAVFAILTKNLTPASYIAGGSSPALYRLTQPWLALHYLKVAFLPNDLSADSDWTYVDPLSPKAMAGYLFVAAMLWAAWRTYERRETRPICFGILWFFIALAPTSLMVLADVTNDHRMFFPFVGLALAVFWSVRLALQQRPEWIRAAIAIFAVVLIAEAIGTHQRNRVWHNEVSLWADVAKKSPHNSRGLMAYATAQMRQNDFVHGLPYLERAASMSPEDFLPAMNLGIAYGAMKRSEDADRQFQRAQVLAPNLWEPHFFYGRWLESQGRRRLPEAQRELETAIKMNRHSFEARNLLMQVYEEEGNQQALEALAQDTLALADEKLPGETTAPNALPPVKQPNLSALPMKSGDAEKDAAVAKMASDDLARQAANACRKNDYDTCLAKARQAVDLRPDYVEAMNVIAMAQFATGHGDEGIETLQQALKINPNYETAKKNLAWALEQRKKALESGETKKQ